MRLYDPGRWRWKSYKPDMHHFVRRSVESGAGAIARRNLVLHQIPIGREKHPRGGSSFANSESVVKCIFRAGLLCPIQSPKLGSLFWHGSKTRMTALTPTSCLSRFLERIGQQDEMPKLPDVRAVDGGHQPLEFLPQLGGWLGSVLVQRKKTRARTAGETDA